MSTSDQTFLELCQEMARDVGIPGSGPTTTLGQTGENEKIVRYVANADLDIKRRWIDWRFLWKDDFSVSLAANDQAVTSATTGWPTYLGTWHWNRFVLDATTSSYVELAYMPYEQFRGTYLLGSVSSGTPGDITIKPDNTLALGPKCDKAYTLTGQYWKRTVRLTANSDVSDIPAHFRRLIVVRAKLYYAEHENAPEVSHGAGAEHDDLMNQLIAQYGPDQAVKSKFRADGSERMVVVPQ